MVRVALITFVVGSTSPTPTLCHHLSIQVSVLLDIFSTYKTFNCRQPSLSGCRPPDLEFFTGARRHGSNTSVFQEALENVLTATIVLTSTLVVLEVTSVT